MRKFAFLASALWPVLCHTQVTVVGAPSIVGSVQFVAPAQYTHIWAYAPPASGADNTTFVNDVMPQPDIDGVSLVEGWSSIETAAPTSTACTGAEGPDVCQLDPLVTTYHRYSWATYDSSTPPGIYQWFATFGGVKKRVNILPFGIAAAPTNSATPSYITGSTYISLFTAQYSGYDRQDVINYPQNQCSGWKGVSMQGNVARDLGGLVTVTMWTGQPFSSTDTVFVGGFSGANSSWNTMAGGSALSSVMSSSFTYQSQCNTGTCSNGTPSLSGVSIISAAQSYPVPYEYPYKSALKAFWAALVAHYNIVNFPTYYSQLNYLRFGGSVGSEWYPYCTASLGALTAPYQYRQSGTNATFTGWVDYYAEMVLYTQSLGSTLQVMWSINSAEVPPVYDYADTEATTAMAYANAFGAKNGFGSQGLSVQDVLNCTFGTNNCDPPPSPPLNPSASNWHPNFKNVRANASILELQQSAISYPKDTNCTNGCGTGNGSYSGDLANWMQFAWQSGATDFEVYWRDLELAYGDGAYCTVNAFNNGCSLLISLGGQLVDQAQVAQFFRAVGRGQTSPGTWCPTSSQTAAKATGDCSYATALHSAHGPHP